MFRMLLIFAVLSALAGGASACPDHKNKSDKKSHSHKVAKCEKCKKEKKKCECTEDEKHDAHETKKGDNNSESK